MNPTSFVDVSSPIKKRNSKQEHPFSSSPLKWLASNLGSPALDHHSSHHETLPLSPVGSTMMSFSLSSPHPHDTYFTGSNLLEHDQILAIEGSNPGETDLSKAVFSPSIFSPTKNPTFGIAMKSSSSKDLFLNSSMSTAMSMNMNQLATSFSVCQDPPPLAPFLSSTLNMNMNMNMNMDMSNIIIMKSSEDLDLDLDQDEDKDYLDDEPRQILIPRKKGKQSATATAAAGKSHQPPPRNGRRKADAGKDALNASELASDDTDYDGLINPAAAVAAAAAGGGAGNMNDSFCSGVTSNASLTNGYLHQKYFDSPAGPNVSVGNAIVTAGSSSSGSDAIKAKAKHPSSSSAKSAKMFVLSPTDRTNESPITDVGDRSSAVSVSPPATQCKCRKSRCLKLYCDCFAILAYCGASCSCINCHNTVAQDVPRKVAITTIKERNHLAFQSKISDAAGHAAGCHCRQSHCLKKYCECFNGGAFCAQNCKCSNCFNHYDSPELAKVKENTSSRGSQVSEESKKRKQQTASQVKSDSTPDSRVQSKRFEIPSTKISDGSAATSSDTQTQKTQKEGNGKVRRKAVKREISECSSDALGNTSGRNKVVKTEVAPADEGDGALCKSILLSDPSAGKKAAAAAPSTRAGEKKKSVKFEKGVASAEAPAPAPAEPALPAPVVCYPFFGPDNASTPKVIALRCLEYLGNSDIYQVSQVSSIWSKAAMDESMWEQ